MVIWKDGVLVTPAHVNEDGTISPAVYEGETPLSAELLNLMQRIDKKSITVAKGTTIVNEYEITLPLKYQVGNNSLQLFWNGDILIKATDTEDGHYKEVRSSRNNE